jgi:hypothetical protein
MAAINAARARVLLRALVTDTAISVRAFAEEVNPAHVQGDVGRDLRAVIAAHQVHPCSGPASRYLQRLERALSVLETKITSENLAEAVVVMERLAGLAAYDSDFADVRSHDDVASLTAAAFDSDAAVQDAFRRAYKGEEPHFPWLTVDAVRTFMEDVAAARQAVAELHNVDDAADEVHLSTTEPVSAARDASRGAAS